MCQYSEERVIVTANNSTYLVEKEGVMNIGASDTRTIKPSDVFHVPSLKRNLVLVSQITNSRNYVLFRPNDVKVLNNLKNVATNVVLTGEKKDSLFVISVREAYMSKISQTNSTAIWHARLGQLGYQLLHQIS